MLEFQCTSHALALPIGYCDDRGNNVKPTGKIVIAFGLSAMAVATALCSLRAFFDPDNRVMNLIFEAPTALAIFVFSVMALWTIFSKS